MPVPLPAHNPGACANVYRSRLGWRIAQGFRYLPRGGCSCEAAQNCPTPGAHPLPHRADRRAAQDAAAGFAVAPGAGVIASTSDFDAVVLPRSTGMAAMVLLDRVVAVPCIAESTTITILVEPGGGNALAYLPVDVRSGPGGWIALPPSHGVRWDTPPWDEVTEEPRQLVSGEAVRPSLDEAFRVAGDRSLGGSPPSESRK